jgi:hypothetical protein
MENEKVPRRFGDIRIIATGTVTSPPQGEQKTNVVPSSNDKEMVKPKE